MVDEMITEANIDNMPAGREMDALVCEKVMGHFVRHGGIFGLERLMPKYIGKELHTLSGYESRHGNSYYVFENGFDYAYGIVPYYSIDIRMAWEIEQEGWQWDFLETSSRLHARVEIWIAKPRQINLHLERAYSADVYWKEFTTK